MHSLKNWSRILDVGNGPGHNLFVAWSQGTSPLHDRSALTINGVENRVDNALVPFTIDLEHHVVLSIDEGGGSAGRTRVSVFLDGQPRGSFETTYRLGQLVDTDYWLGRSHYADEIASASYDEVRIHDRMYSNGEVQQLYARGPVRTAPPASIAIVAPGRHPRHGAWARCAVHPARGRARSAGAPIPVGGGAMGEQPSGNRNDLSGNSVAAATTNA